jgi:eukaryotic-like serine/threonine-protein kinase
VENPFGPQDGEVETGTFRGTPGEATRSRDAAPGDLVGPYRLISELGRGGMGAVWLAERTDGQLKRQVALKLPHIAWGGALAERLTRERDILASLEHAHIARLYDAGVDREGRPFLAMEYVEGRPIDVYCREQALPLGERIGLLLQVAAAVAHAHARLVVHRDLKPGNILVRADGQVQLLDFGIAKLIAGDRTEETFLTEMSGRALTPDYASPEQIRGEPLGTASDVYSLGAVSYELLTGARPYRLKRGTPAELEEAITSIDAPLPSEAAREPAVRRQLKGDLDAILNKALKKDAGQRYPTVEAFAEDLRRHLNQQPVLAQPDRFGYRAGKFIRRYRLQVAAGVIVAVALLAGAGVALWQAQRARAQASRAEEVKRLVLSIFEDADTAGGGSRKTSAADLLEQARARLAAVPVSDPAVRAELLTSVGMSLVGLGEYKQATQVLEDATRLAVAQLGAGHRETIHAQLALGEALVESGEKERAGPHLDAAARGMRQLRDTVGLVNALRWKANLLSDQGRFEQALESAGEARELAESRLTGTNKRLVMLANHTLAGTRISARRDGPLAPARRAYELAREIASRRVTVDVLNARSLYGYALVLEGETEKGVSELKALVQQQIDLLGVNHLDVLRTLGRIGNASLALGDPLTALDSFERGLRILLATDEAATVDVGRFHLAVGRALVNARRYDEAYAKLSQATQILAARLGPENFDTRIATATAGYALARAGRLEEAEAVFARLLSLPAGQPPEQAQTNLRLGALRSAQGRHDEAQKVLRDALAVFSKATPINHAVALAALGEAQIEAGLAPGAFETLTRARELFESLQPALSPDRADLLVNLARVQIAIGRPEEAVASAGQAAAFWRSFDAANRSTGIALLWHARALHAAGDQTKATEPLQQASAILAIKGQPADRSLLERTRAEWARRRR